MPKPKRRPPVVKTDWVLEIGPEEGPIARHSRNTKQGAIDISKDWPNSEKRIFKRTWRKVDL